MRVHDVIHRRQTCGEYYLHGREKEKEQRWRHQRLPEKLSSEAFTSLEAFSRINMWKQVCKAKSNKYIICHLTWLGKASWSSVDTRLQLRYLLLVVYLQTKWIWECWDPKCEFRRKSVFSGCLWFWFSVTGVFLLFCLRLRLQVVGKLPSLLRWATCFYLLSTIAAVTSLNVTRMCLTC